MEVQNTPTTQGTADTDQGDGRGQSDICDTSLLCWSIGGTARNLCDPDWIRYIKKSGFIACWNFFLFFSFFLDTSLYTSYECSDHVEFSSPAVKLSQNDRRSAGIILLVRKNLKQFVQKINVQYGHFIVVKLSKQLVGGDCNILYVSVLPASRISMILYELVSWCFEPSQPHRITSGPVRPNPIV